ncbi:MAG: multicopper oxidase domain-containing protein [Methylococcaceae bacterium]|nr:multicopper oxidase domain-containing protein [Methylococcaceae bacterium]
MKKLTQAIILGALGLGAQHVHAATISKSLCVGSLSKTLYGTSTTGKSVTFWGYSDCGGGGMGGMGGGTAIVPGPIMEIGVNDTLNISFSPMGMMTMEGAPYNGHTIHLHGADVQTMEDGVPETNGNMVMGDTYTWTPSAGHEGSYMYHCHVHTVKHLEMGMYSAIIVRPKNASGAFLNQLNANTTTAYDYSQNYILSTVDPAYHTASGDSVVFADYNPSYFLMTGKEGKSTAAPAMTLAAAKGKKVAFRLVGLHSTNATFQIKNGSGVAQPFTVYIRDGRTLPTAKTVTSLDLSPGQRADLITTLPTTSSTWYPQITYKKLRANTDGTYPAYATVYGKVTF